MADNSTIIANTENIENVVITFSKQLDDYSSKMHTEVEKLKASILALKSGWESQDYNVFANNMDAKIKCILHELESSDKLKKYLEEVAAQIKDFLNTLRNAGGN